jgi:MoaA/NifB/PqqE/SkfB family radical SAM enzyme
MRCNYNCTGCYSRGRPSEKELSTKELDELFTEAEGLGVHAIVVTGGEPLLRRDLPGLIEAHSRLLFVIITNGALITPTTANRLAQSGNAITLVSIEGTSIHTDDRRGSGAHKTAIRAFELLSDAKACFGFSATITVSNAHHIVSDAFIDEMISFGCSVGYLVEYIPCGKNAMFDWVLEGEERLLFRQQLLSVRRSKPIILIHFPDDEYGKDNRCAAAGRESFHINAQGDVEPCPFMPIAQENIRRGGLRAACRSKFFREIRENPELLRRGRYACSLFEHREEIEAIAEKYCAFTNIPFKAQTLDTEKIHIQGV